MTGSATPPAPRRCEATKADGTACKAHPLKSGRWCAMHDPERREQHRAMSAKGGASSWRVRIDRVAADTAVGGLLAYLTEIMAELRRSRLPSDDVARLRAAVYAASVAVKVVETAELGTELERLRDLVDSGSWREHVHQA